MSGPSGPLMVSVERLKGPCLRNPRHANSASSLSRLPNTSPSQHFIFIFHSQSWIPLHSCALPPSSWPAFTGSSSSLAPPGKPTAHLSGGSISAAKVQDSYKQYWSFFLRPKEIQNVDNVPSFVDTFYNLVTDIYEWGWGQSFHFSPSVPGKSHREATRIHEELAVDLLEVRPGSRILDVGYGLGRPMSAIAAHSGANVVGITINEYQVSRAKMHNKNAGLDKLCEVVCGNFLNMPFKDNSFDGAYSMEATCHSPKLEEVYAEIYRVLKPGATYVSYEWVTTELYKPEDSCQQGIERADALPGLRSYSDIGQTAKKVGFEVVKEKDLAKAPAKA